MRCAKAEVLEAIDAAPVGVFAFRASDGSPRACAVTPYAVADRAVVSSTLAFTSKVAAVRRDPRVALLAGGWLASGEASVDVDLSSRTFDREVRAQELRKYPPSRQLLWVPGHRRLLWWYVGRGTIRIPLEHCVDVGGDDRLTVTWIDGGTPRIVPLDRSVDVDLDGDELPVPLDVRGPAVVLAHVEDERMADLRQLALHGTASDGTFRVARRAGTTEPTGASTSDQLRTLWRLSKAARRNRPALERRAAQEGTLS